MHFPHTISVRLFPHKAPRTLCETRTGATFSRRRYVRQLKEVRSFGLLLRKASKRGPLAFTYNLNWLLPFLLYPDSLLTEISDTMCLNPSASKPPSG